MERKSTALITGGKGGLGTALASSLSCAGLQVLNPSRQDLDVSSGESVENYFKESLGENSLDLLICNAGVIDDVMLSKMTENSWDHVVDVNLRGAFIVAREAAKLMVKRKVGHIVFISSFAAFHPSFGQANYAAAKAALAGMAKSMAKELGGRNIRVNVVVPGFMVTKMTAQLPEKVIDSVKEKHTLNDFNVPERVGSFIKCLHLEMLSTSGQVFNLDSRIL